MIRLILTLALGLSLTCCATVEGEAVPSPAEQQQRWEQCKDKTQLDLTFIQAPSDNEGPSTLNWRERIEKNIRLVNQAFLSDAFRKQCPQKSFKRTRGRTAVGVCEDLGCAGPKEMKIGFFYNPATSAIASHSNGVTLINAAKPSTSKAGSAGNLAHEFAHLMDYSHFTNKEWIARRLGSVPYPFGDLMEEVTAPTP